VLDRHGPPGELDDIAVIENEALTLLLGCLDDPRTVASAFPIDHAERLAAQLLVDDRFGPRLREKRFEYDISVRVYAPLDDGLTQPPGGADDDSIWKAGFGIDREHDARSAQVRTDHLLNADRQRNLEMIEAFRIAV